MSCFFSNKRIIRGYLCSNLCQNLSQTFKRSGGDVSRDCWQRVGRLQHVADLRLLSLYPVPRRPLPRHPGRGGPFDGTDRRQSRWVVVGHCVCVRACDVRVCICACVRAWMYMYVCVYARVWLCAHLRVFVRVRYVVYESVYVML